MLKVKFVIDHYSPGGNPYTYQLVEIREQGEHPVTNYRMTAEGFLNYLDGMIDCMEQYRGVLYNSSDEFIASLED